MWGVWNRERDQTAIFSVKSNHTSEYNFAYICHLQGTKACLSKNKKKEWILVLRRAGSGKEGCDRTSRGRPASLHPKQAALCSQQLRWTHKYITGTASYANRGTNLCLCKLKCTGLCSPQGECPWSKGPQHPLIVFIQAKRRNHNTIWPEKWPRGTAVRKAERNDF